MKSVEQFDLNLARVLAASILFFTKEEYSPNGIVDDVINGDPEAPDPMESTAESMQAFITYLPQLIAMQKQFQPVLENTRLKTSELYTPRWNRLQAQMFERYGPRLADTAQRIDAANKLAGSQADLAVLQGPGRESVRSVLDMLRETDPEFFALREKAAGSVGDLLGGGLTGAEEEAIERKLSRDRISRGLSTPTSTNTVSEAMQFGDAARKRQLEGIAAVTSFLPASRTGFDPTQIALGRPSINTGDAKFMGVQQPTSAENTSNNFFNQIAGFRNAQIGADTQRRDWLDRLTEFQGSVNV